jgi:hypothetical protein
MTAALPSPMQRPGALLFVWFGRAVAAFLVALPFAHAVSAPLVHFPEGDRLLYAPGATYLVEVVRLHAGQLATALRVSGWLLLALGFAQLVPVAALLTALYSTRRPDLNEAAKKTNGFLRGHEAKVTYCVLHDVRLA